MGFYQGWEGWKSSLHLPTRHQHRMVIMYYLFSRYNHLLFFFSLTLLSGCNPNSDLALLMSYPKEGICSIDAPERNATIRAEEELLIRGWAYNPKNKKITATLAMYFVNEDDHKMYTASIKREGKREDVAKALDNPVLVDSGFGGRLEKSKLQSGVYQVMLLQIDPHVGVLSCAGDPHRITVE